MRRRIRLTLWFLVGAGLVVAGCTLTPHMNMGLDFDYYGGSFHVRPNAHVGVYGRP